MKKLNKQIKMFRKQKGWTQSTLGRKAGLLYTTIAGIEQGTALHPTIQTITKIADAFEITIDELIGRTFSIGGKRP